MGLFVNPTNYPSVASFNESLELLNEAYFGDDMLKDAQKYLSEYRADLLTNKTLIKSSHPSIQKFNHEMEKIFGFYIFELNVVDAKITNASTMPISYRMGYNHRNKNKCTFNRKTGYKYDPELKYCCIVNIYTGIIGDSRFTDREVMGVILHEIGHNFQEIALDYEGKLGLNFIKQNLASFAYLNMLISNIIDAILNGDIQLAANTVTGIVTGIFLNNTLMQRIIMKTDRMFLDSFPGAYRGLESVTTVIGRIHGGINDFFRSIAYVINSVALMNPMTLLMNMGFQMIKGMNPINLVTLGVSYNNEKFADNFATMYGYGPECASTQAKFERIGYASTAEDIINKMPLTRMVLDLFWGPVIATASVFDCHPYAKTRMTDQADLLRKELERTSTNPRMKQQIKKEMLEIEAIAAAFDAAQQHSQTTTNYLEVEPKVYTVLYKEMFIKMFGDEELAAKMVSGTELHEMIDKKFR